MYPSPSLCTSLSECRVCILRKYFHLIFETNAIKFPSVLSITFGAKSLGKETGVGQLVDFTLDVTQSCQPQHCLRYSRNDTDGVAVGLFKQYND